MPLHPFAIFRVSSLGFQSKSSGIPDQYFHWSEVLDGFLSALSRIHEVRSTQNSISITNGNESEPENLDAVNYTQYNLFVREGTAWTVTTSSTGNLDGLAEDIIDAIRSKRADEIVICPPGAFGPRIE